MVSLGNLARQVEKWPMDSDLKMRTLNMIRALALQACELQLLAVTEVWDPAKFRGDLDRVMSALRGERDGRSGGGGSGEAEHHASETPDGVPSAESRTGRTLAGCDTRQGARRQAMSGAFSFRMMLT
ncbi:hypothetical protein [Shinella sp.]|uniref:hypothetical protein n=1 Tax=Shinella sp. TaxID=1870904 RepID=UPI003F730EBF